MGPVSQRHRIEEVKMIDMVGYLSGLGFEPSKVRNNDYWYLSPLRGEHEPSFKVNRHLNRWYDHGLGKGGNIIDFGILYHQCSVADFLDKVTGGFSFHPPITHKNNKQEKEHSIIVLKDTVISSFPLLRYLQQREIPPEVYNAFCREVSYRLHDRNYYGIGFRNDSGGFELRNPYFKASSSPKDVTTFSNGSSEVKVFEGFMDFLSFRAIQKDEGPLHDYMVLNSLSFFEKARHFLEQHEHIGLYLDRDTAGQNCSRKALALSGKYKDESNAYDGFKDVNDWLVNAGKGQRKRQRKKL